MTAPLPPALDYLIGQLETTAEQCKGGDGSRNALRKNGRGEGLRIAATLLREKWPAILAQMDLPSAVEAERLRAALAGVMASTYSADDVRLLAVGFAGSKVGDDVHAKCDRIKAAHDVARETLATPAQPSELWDGVRGWLADLHAAKREDCPADLIDDGAEAWSQAMFCAASWFREVLGLPPKEDR